MYKQIQPKLETELKSIEEAGLFKKERIIETPQGAEIKVLEGAKEILKKDVVLMLEYDERSLMAGDIDPAYYMDYIKNLGFNIYGIDEEGNLCKPVLLKKKAVNLICIKNESNFIKNSV